MQRRCFYQAALTYVDVVDVQSSCCSACRPADTSDCRVFLVFLFTCYYPPSPLHLRRTGFAPGAFQDNGHATDFSVVRSSILREADVSHNHIKVMGDLAHHKQLVKLNLSHNHIRGITGLVALTSLQVRAQGDRAYGLCVGVWLCVRLCVRLCV